MDEERHLVLVGMMGVGKTSAGHRLALRLGRPFIDIDRVIEERAGKTVPEIFAGEGEPAFRALEADAVRETLDSDTWAVVAFGGGAVLDAATRDRARRAALVVWLQAPPRELARRVSASTTRSGRRARPLLTGGPPEATLEALAAEREAAYREVAHVLVDTTGRSPSQVATAVLGAAGWQARV